MLEDIVCNIELLLRSQPIKTIVSILKTVFFCVRSSEDDAVFEVSFETTAEICIDCS